MTMKPAAIKADCVPWAFRPSSKRPKNDDPLPESDASVAPPRFRIPRMRCARTTRSGASSSAACSSSLVRIEKALNPSKSLDTKRKILLLFSRGVKLWSTRANTAEVDTGRWRSMTIT